ncbi:hypothetical protein BRADI_3g30815v3 [Brachypodium distachyon]|uniref:Uncharacterized protein n=1 Tax=Brachypodium distachyon TaxID=15368 RepID=A0A2K2D0B3_BRADI|nr:hypothetical protein BRADI_3g30815v3 [Brachypodium distachyon]
MVGVVFLRGDEGRAHRRQQANIGTCLTKYSCFFTMQLCVFRRYKFPKRCSEGCNGPELCWVGFCYGECANHVGCSSR